ncbi:MAG: hypothetical protein M1838_000811 [Thelocarpon superellum]|nr:MAG: hypothetical protein M1838_000811 [Thelocarpon superellum]
MSVDGTSEINPPLSPMTSQFLVDRVRGLNDLELVVLLSLVANEHCIIAAEEEALDPLEDELKLVVEKVFGLSHAVVDCSEHTTLDDFARAILIPDNRSDPSRAQSPTSLKQEGSYFRSKDLWIHSPAGPQRFDAQGSIDTRKIANVVIAKNLDLASQQVQVQALELLRTRRMFTRTEIHAAPQSFLFIPLIAGTQPNPQLMRHLNDHIFMSHYHAPEDGFPNADEGTARIDSETESTESVVKKTPRDTEALFSGTEIDNIGVKADLVTMDMDVKRYMHNIVVFLRMHRAVAGGVTSQSTRHMDLLVRCLAPLHALQFVTPSLVALAARKVYQHRIAITTVANERSMQWGSDADAVAAYLDGLTAEDIIEEVLGMVDVPL